MDLSDKVVILTGASRGIGRAAAHRFAGAGCKVALVARSTELLNELAAGLGPERALALPADVGDPEACDRLVAQTTARFGGVDILVNNAGVGINGPGVTASLNDLHRVMQVNYFGPLHLIRACAPQFKQRGGGLVINVSSIVGRRSVPWSAGYCASKGALERLVESLRIELAADNIRFCTLYPGLTRTNFTPHALGLPRQPRERIKGVSADRAAAKLVRAAQKEPRDAFVTLFDRLFVSASRMFPGPVDAVFRWYFKETHPLPGGSNE
ncbi:MAG: SDR family NAD(P)-dependent oxidoreductase [Anaerolineae bacterium]